MDFKTSILRGIGWTTIANIGSQLISLGTTVVLARLLVPEEFGLVAMILVFTGFAKMLADFGLAPAIVQKKDITDTQLSSLFWLNNLLGVGLFGIGIVLAPFIASFYEEPALVALTYGMSASFILGALGIVPSALIRKAMRFRLFSIITLISVLLASAAAIGSAYAGLGAWALVIQALVRALIASLLYLRYGGWRPGFAFNLQSVIPMIRYGLGYVGYSVINYWAKHIDNLLVGKLLGSGPLGYYNEAYKLMRLPVSQVMGSLSGVMFPALSSIQDDHERCKRVYLKTMSTLSMATFPIAIGVLVLGEPLILTFLGDQWVQSIPILQILAITGVSSTFSNPTGWLYKSQGRTDIMFWWGLGGSGTLVVGIAIGATFMNVEAIATGYTVAHVLLMVPSVAIPGRLIGMTFREVFAATRGALACAAAMGGFMALLHYVVLPPDFPAPATLGIVIPTGLLFYFGLLHFLDIRGFGEVRRLLWSSWKKFTNKTDDQTADQDDGPDDVEKDDVKKDDA